MEILESSDGLCNGDSFEKPPCSMFWVWVVFGHWSYGLNSLSHSIGFRVQDFGFRI